MNQRSIQRGIKILSRGFMVPKMKSSGDSFAHPICSLGKDLTLKSKKNLSSIFQKGLIQTEDGTHYLIEPVREQNSSNVDDEHSHAVYRRSFDDSLLPWKQQGTELCSDQGTDVFSDEVVASNVNPYISIDPLISLCSLSITQLFQASLKRKLREEMPCGYSSKSFWRHDHFHYHGKIAMVILLSQL